MEVHLTADLEQKLNELASLSGRSADELVQAAVAGMFDKLAQKREMLDRRYDDMKNGRVKGISGEEAEAHFREKRESALRAKLAG